MENQLHSFRSTLPVDKKDQNCVEVEDLRRALRYDPQSLMGSPTGFIAVNRLRRFAGCHRGNVCQKDDPESYSFVSFLLLILFDWSPPCHFRFGSNVLPDYRMSYLPQNSVCGYALF